MRKRTNERLTEGEREREIEMTGVCALSSSSFLLLLPPIISEVYKYMRVKKMRECVRHKKNLLTNDKKNKFLRFFRFVAIFSFAHKFNSYNT